MTATELHKHGDAAQEIRRGTLAAIGAYLIWGLTPIYFKALASVGAAEIIAHRILWSVFLLAAVLLLARQGSGFRVIRKSPRVLGGLAISAVLVTSNWLVYVWAINADRVLEASLGYYINPLVTVLLAALVLRERMNRWQKAAFVLATLGVINQVFQVGALPWVALFLATSFALYGLARKRLAINPITGLLVETMLVAPLAVGYLMWLASTGAMAFSNQGWSVDLLLAAAGLVTSLPLVMFAFAARRLRLATMGFLQYLAPTLMLILGVVFYGEPFGSGRLATFALIWTGLAVFSWDAWRTSTTRQR